MMLVEQISFFHLLLFLFCCVFSFFLTVKVTGSLLTPASLWSLGWLLLILFTTIFGSDYFYSYTMLIVILGFIISFVIGYIVMNSLLTGRGKLSQIKAYRSIPEVYPIPASSRIQIVFLSISMISLSIMLSKFGLNISMLSNFSSIANSASSNASMVYSGEVSLGMNETIGFAFLQAAFVLNGIDNAMNNRKKHRYLFFVVIVFGSLLWSAVTTTRSYIVVPLVWWIAGFYAAKVYRNDVDSLIDSAFIRKLLLFIAVLVLVILFFQAVRMSGDEGEFNMSLLEHMRPWIAGYVPALSVWYENNWSGDYQYGSNLFRPFLKIFGISIGENIRDTVGLQYIGNGHYSNALTLVRALIYDFGIYGSLIFTFYFGLFSSYIYNKTHLGNKYAFVALVGIMTTIVWAPNYWFYSYGSRVLVLILLVCFIVFSTIKIKRY